MLNRLTNSPLVLVALQFIPIALIPPSQLSSMLILTVVEALFLIAVVFGVWRRRAWSQTLSIFVMGFNIISRVMLFFPHIVERGSSVDLVFGIMMLVSIALSWIFLSLMERPEVTMRLSS
jgi:hypothetical protein